MAIRPSRIIFPLLTFGASLALVILVLEACLRLFAPQDLIRAMAIRLDPELIYTLTPGHEAFLKGTDTRKFHLKTNSLGLRDREILFNKAPGVYRILLLGDSTSMAEGVEIDDIYLKRLEKLLNRESRHVETINAAIRGYGNDQELLLYRRLGKRFAPDLVILAFFTQNDFDDNWNGQLFKVERGKLIQQRPTPESSRKFKYYQSQARAQNWPGYSLAMAHSHLANWLRNRMALLITGRIYNDTAAAYPAASHPLEEEPRCRLTLAILKAWNEEVQQDGARSLLLIIPFRYDVRQLRQEPPAEIERKDLAIERFCGNEHIACLNLTPAFIKYKGDFEALWLDGGHFTPEGHAWVAQELARYLTKSFLK
jgi:hypothetical protein